MVTHRMIQSYNALRSERTDVPHAGTGARNDTGQVTHVPEFSDLANLADMANLMPRPSPPWTLYPGSSDGPLRGPPEDSVSVLMNLIATSDEGSSTVVSPAIADDDRVFQEYLSATPSSQSRRMVRFHLNLGNGPDSPNTSSASGHNRPVLFTVVPKRGQRETESRSLAASNCEIAEKLIEPYQNDVLDMQVHLVRSKDKQKFKEKES